MPPSVDTTRPRRTVLKLLGAAAGAATVGSVVTADDHESEDDPSYVLEQGDDCFELVPLSGDEPVEDFYDYRYPTELFDSISGSHGGSYSSHGTVDLQEDDTSILFLYDGPEGLSLVVVHGKLEDDDEVGDGDDGGVVTFELENVPEDAEWVVRDDYYLEDGEQADTNFDQWDVDGTDQQIDWVYRAGRTDGGALFGLGEEFEFSIDPAFNDDAVLAEASPYTVSIDDWEALSGDGESPERFSLQMDEPITIRSGTCEDEDEGDDGEDQDEHDESDDEHDGEDDESDDEHEDDDGKDDDGEDDDEHDEEDDTDDQDGGKDKEEDSDEDC